MTVHTRTLHKLAKIFVEIKADFATPFAANFVWIALSVAEIRLFLYRFDGYIDFTKQQFLRANHVERNVSVHTSVY